MLTFLQEIKTSPDYQEVFSTDTRREFDLYEKTLCGNAEAIVEVCLNSP
jgi:hypothetical protein